MEAELRLKELRKLQQHIIKRTCKRCIYFKRDSSNYRMEFSCTTRNHPHFKYEPLRVKATGEACALYEDVLKTNNNQSF